MAEAAVEAPVRDETAAPIASNGEGVVRIPKVRPPDKKKYEEDMEKLCTSIKAKEAQLKSLNSRAEDGAQNELHTLRIEKDATIGRRKKIDNSLRNVNQEIAKQQASLNTLQATLQYKNEERINEVIRRLEHQLKTNNFSLRDEKKIVANIDQLKRSRHSLVQYNALKKEIDGMRDRQRRMREERDHLFKKVTALKAQEDGIKKSFTTNKERIDKIKKEIEDLKGQKSTLFMDFKNQEEEFRQARDAYRKLKNSEYKQKKEEERRIQMEAFQKELEEYEASREPYEDEKQLCATLITYLQKFLQGEGDADPPATTPTAEGKGFPGTGDAAGEHPSGMYVLRKKSEEEDTMFGGVVRPKTNKRSKRDKRRAFNRPIVHTPQIFAQFASLQLSAPPNVAEVTAAIDLLHAKKKHFDSLPPPNPSIMVESGPGVGGARGGGGGGNTSDGSAGAPSVAESAICESIPSTPEMMLDAPRFPGGGGRGGGGNALEESGGWPRLRKLSKDSGTELEETNNCDELNTSLGDNTGVGDGSSGGGGGALDDPEDFGTTLDPRDFDIIPTDDVITPLSLEAVSAFVTSPKIDLVPGVGGSGEGSTAESGNQECSGDQGGDDVTVTSSSTSTTPTNSVDTLDSTSVVAPSNNNNVVASESQNQPRNATATTDANSNPSDLHGNDDATSPVPSASTDVRIGEGGKLQVVLSGLVTTDAGDVALPCDVISMEESPAANQEAALPTAETSEAS